VEGDLTEPALLPSVGGVGKNKGGRKTSVHIKIGKSQTLTVIKGNSFAKGGGRGNRLNRGRGQERQAGVTSFPFARVADAGE